MVLDFQDTFDRVVAKANILAEKYRLLAQSRDRAVQRAAELEQLLTEREKELQKLREEAEYLRMASVIAPSREQVEATRAVISGLVREIDRCITDLSD